MKKAFVCGCLLEGLIRAFYNSYFIDDKYFMLGCVKDIYFLVALRKKSKPLTCCFYKFIILEFLSGQQPTQNHQRRQRNPVLYAETGFYNSGVQKFGSLVIYLQLEHVFMCSFLYVQLWTSFLSRLLKSSFCHQRRSIQLSAANVADGIDELVENMMNFAESNVVNPVSPNMGSFYWGEKTQSWIPWREQTWLI